MRSIITATITSRTFLYFTQFATSSLNVSRHAAANIYWHNVVEHHCLHESSCRYSAAADSKLKHFPIHPVKVYDLNMVAEREPPEPPRRRARGNVTSMDVDPPDDDDELGEVPAAATTPPLPTPTESVTAAAPSIVTSDPQDSLIITD